MKRIHDRLPSGGALLIAEKLLDEDKTGPRWALMQNLGMLLYTEGKERTLSEYKALLDQVGFADVKGATTSIAARRRSGAEGVTATGTMRCQSRFPG